MRKPRPPLPSVDYHRDASAMRLLVGSFIATSIAILAAACALGWVRP